jgi:Protein of unknown function (DUF1566)
MKKIWLIACMISTSIWAENCPPQEKRTHPDSRFSAVDNTKGAQVRDSVTGLIWMRCVYGQEWDGQQCTGEPIARQFPQAVATVVNAKPWRLPSRDELMAIMDRTCITPTLNKTWFVGDPGRVTWSGTEDDSKEGAWVVHLGNGSVNNLYSKFPLFVRWVR